MVKLDNRNQNILIPVSRWVAFVMESLASVMAFRRSDLFACCDGGTVGLQI